MSTWAGRDNAVGTEAELLMARRMGAHKALLDLPRV
jgi:hypothetical protein